MNVNHHHVLRSLLSVRLCVCCDGCGHCRNEFAGRVQINYVHFSFHRNEIIKLLPVGTLYVAGYAKEAIVAACHCTSDRQEHKII